MFNYFQKRLATFTCCKRWCSIIPETTIRFYLLQKTVFNDSRNDYPPLLVAKMVFNWSRNDYPPLLVAKDDVQLFQKRLSTFTCCKRWCSIIPDRTIHLYLLQKMVFNYFRNDYPPLLVTKDGVQLFQKRLSTFTCCKRWCSVIPETTIHLYLLQKIVFNYSRNDYPPLLVAKDGVQLFQKRLSTFTCCKRWCSIIPETTIHLYLLQKMVFNYSRSDYPPLLVAKDGVQLFQKRLSTFTCCKKWCSITPKTTIHLYLSQKTVFNYSRNDYPPLLVAKDGVQLFQKRLSTFTCCKRWCSIIPETTIHLYLLQRMVCNYSRNDYPPLLVAKDGVQLLQRRLSTFTCCKRWCSIIPETTIHLYLLQKMVFNYSRNDYPPLLVASDGVQLFQKRLSTFTCCKRWCPIIPETTIHLYLLQKTVFNDSRNEYPPLLVAKDGVQLFQKATIHLYVLQKMVFKYSRNDYAPLLVAKDGVQLFHKRLATFTGCKRWCSIIPETTIHLYLLQKIVLSYSRND